MHGLLTTWKQGKIKELDGELDIKIAGNALKFVLEVKRELRNLEENSNDAVKSSIGKHWASAHGIDVDYAIAILRNIKAGIEDKDNK